MEASFDANVDKILSVPLLRHTRACDIVRNVSGGLVSQAWREHERHEAAPEAMREFRQRRRSWLTLANWDSDKTMLGRLQVETIGWRQLWNSAGHDASSVNASAVRNLDVRFASVLSRIPT